MTEEQSRRIDSWLRFFFSKIARTSPVLAGVAVATRLGAGQVTWLEIRCNPAKLSRPSHARTMDEACQVRLYDIQRLLGYTSASLKPRSC